MHFTLYPIYWLADQVGGRTPFDLSCLPFDIAEDVRIESVRERFREGEFDHHNGRLGTEVTNELRRVEFALVHRYEPRPIVVQGDVIGERLRDNESESLIRTLAACLRLIRPMRQHALLMRGKIREDGSFNVTGFDIPQLYLFEVPEVQKLFQLRNRDAEDLKTYAPQFLRAMRGEFWKFRMAVQFHELGYFQTLDWKARFLLWCSAVESIYTSHNWEHQGSLVATSRIRWFLNENTSIYAPDDVGNLFRDPGITVGQIVASLYEMRNFMAHGDKIPEAYFTEALRQGLNGSVSKREVLLEAASFIIRASLLKILREDLLDHFADAGPAETYFSAQNLTKSVLRRAP